MRPKCTPIDARESFYQQRLRGARHAFDQHVTFTKQDDQNLFDYLVLADYGFAHFGLNMLDDVADRIRQMDSPPLLCFDLLLLKTARQPEPCGMQ